MLTKRIVTKRGRAMYYEDDDRLHDHKRARVDHDEAMDRSKSFEEERKMFNETSNELVGKINFLTKAVSQRDAEIYSLNSDLSQRDAEVYSLNSDLSQRDAEV